MNKDFDKIYFYTIVFFFFRYQFTTEFFVCTYITTIYIEFILYKI